MHTRSNPCRGRVIIFFALLIQLSFAQTPSGLNVDYSDLVDKGALIRTGQNLGSALGNNRLKGALQPFLDKYSYLLEYAIEMVSKESPTFRNVVENYPVGTEQPAWVALFRSGRMSAYTDNKRTVRLFLQGGTPQAAYNQNYSVVRHLLNSLKPVWGKLIVEVYSFDNDYRSLAFKLNPEPVIIRGSYFGTPFGKTSLDLEGLRDFFAMGGQLEGAQIHERTGLSLYSKVAQPQTLDGAPVQLADLSVAYRAVFHAGDNKAFISLDPHADVTKAAVNFGGYLEDTAIGKVVLDADKRFKTITSGLDPNNGNDIRTATRQHVPLFLTVSEREGMTGIMNNKGWVKTRFWFYPDSIEVQTDPSKHFARIINPRFLADAERSRDDFGSSAEYEKKKKSLLLPAIQANIDDLNRNYTQYAQAFREFRELETVGRLMAICSWLFKVDPQGLDLDALLSVKIPAVHTERERTQLIAASTLNPEKNRLDITYLTPELDKSISTYFNDTKDLAHFLSEKSGHEDASRIMNSRGHEAVRTLIHEQKDLQAFALFAGERKRPIDAIRLEISQMEEENKALAEKRKELYTLQETIQNSPDMTLEPFNAEVKAYQARTDRFNKRVADFNQNQRKITPLLVEVGGGIDLESESFKMSTVQNSPQLKSFKAVVMNTKTDWTDAQNGERWVTNKVRQTRAEVQRPTLFLRPAPNSRGVQRRTVMSKPKKAVNIDTTIVVRSTAESGSIKGEFIDSQHIVFKRVR